MENQSFCLKWKKQLHHLQKALTVDLDRQVFCDVSLASEGEVFHVHQFVLSACSPYFQNILNSLPRSKHPIIFLSDVSPLEIKALLEYMYKGEAILPHALLPAFVKTCERLKIQGLSNRGGDKRATLSEKSTGDIGSETIESDHEGANLPITSQNINNFNRFRKKRHLLEKEKNADNLNENLKCDNKKQKITDHSDQNVKGSSEQSSDDLPQFTLHPNVEQQIVLSGLNRGRNSEKAQNKQTSKLGEATTSQCDTNIDNFSETTQVVSKVKNNNNVGLDDLPSVGASKTRNMLISPSYPHDSFIFDVHDFDSQSKNFPSSQLIHDSSSKSIIIEDLVLDTIEILDDDKDVTANNGTESPVNNDIESSQRNIGSNSESLNNNSLLSVDMIVNIDVNSPIHGVSDISEDEMQCAESRNLQDSDDDSEIIITRRKKYRVISRNLESSDSSQEEPLQTSETPHMVSSERQKGIEDSPERTLSENLKIEALDRARNMKIVIYKNI